ncbi:MAG: universal stress protein [Chlorobiales bacterium]|nr:universal stress protein [Chlorobiales bacterium]
MQTQHVLCPVDFSEFSLEILDYASQLAQNTNAEIVLLHVIETGSSLSSSSTVSLNQLFADYEKRIREKGVPVRWEIMAGLPENCILAYAWTNPVDLIIVGSHGQTGLTRLLVGTTTEAVMRKAPCPVFIVKMNQRTEPPLIEQDASLCQKSAKAK